MTAVRIALRDERRRFDRFMLKWQVLRARRGKRGASRKGFVTKFDRIGGQTICKMVKT
jgi:hypothetical protein